MTHYYIKRLLLMVPTLLLVSGFAFILVRLMPGDVALLQLSESPKFSQTDIQELRHKLGIDEPIWVAYPKWLVAVLTGDLGDSLWSRNSVASLIWDRAPVTLELAILAFFLSNLIGIPLGVLSAIKQDTPLDYIIRLVSIGGLSLPNFWIATLVIVFGAREFDYLPPITYVPFENDWQTNIQQFIVPAAIIAIASSATIMRMVRSSLLEVLRLDYVRTARAKGLSGRQVIYGHALRNAMLPVLTLQGFQLAFLLTGSVIIEVIFNLPGLGRLMFDSISQRDYPVVQGMVLLYGTIFLGVNLMIDLLYGKMDPRVRYE